MLKAICHSNETGWSEVMDLDDISELRKEPDNVLWAEADVREITPQDVAIIAEEFGLHPLAVEDAVNPRQRPKLEPYESHLFAVLHQLDEEDGQLESVQIACFIGNDFVIALHAGAERTLSEVKERWKNVQKIEVRGPAFLMHAILDAIVDDYQIIADRLETEVEQLEDIALEAPGAINQKQLYSVKQRIARLRRYAIPGARVLDWVVDHKQHSLFSQETAALFRDVHDHILRINDQVRNIEDLSDAVIQLHNSEQAANLNEVTKRLTGWAAIIAVPTFIASVYGMNFTLIPEDGSLFGFLFAVTMMVIAVVWLYVFFRRRNWI